MLPRISKLSLGDVIPRALSKRVQPLVALHGRLAHRVSFIKLALFFAPLVFIFGLVWMKLTDVDLYWRLVAQEDGPVEYLTSLVYLVSFLLAFSVSKHFYHKRQGAYGVLYLFLSLAFIFICVEEVSWGQRIFGMSSPELFEERNYQAELNLHNFAGRYPLHASFILAGAYGAFLPWIAQRIGQTRMPGRLKKLRALFVPGRFLFFYFFPALALYAYYDYFSPILVRLFGPQFGWEFGQGYERFIISSDQEAVEFILAVGFVLFVAIVKLRQRSGEFDDLPKPKLEWLRWWR